MALAEHPTSGPRPPPDGGSVHGPRGPEQHRPDLPGDHPPTRLRGALTRGDRMSTPYLGEIRMFGFEFAPDGWALCNGQLLPISQNTALYNLIGNLYGGDGETTFALPNLQGRVPIHQGQGGG